MNESIKLVTESDAGAIYHDAQNEEWLVDVASKGLMLYFDQEEFQEFLAMLRTVTNYNWELDLQPRAPRGQAVPGE